MPKILAYHKISSDAEFGINTVPPDIFEQHIQTIISSRYQPVTFKQLMHTPVENALVITFDDGYESIYDHAFPILKKYSVPAVIFVLADYIGSKNNWESFAVQRTARHLNTNQLLEMQEFGCEIGSHGRAHHYLPAVSDNILKEELVGSKSILQGICRSEVISFCYPYGRYNRRVIDAVDNAGYKYATCNISWLRSNNGNLTFLRRSIYRTDNRSTFRAKLEQSDRKFTLSMLKEWTIQRGTLPGIWVNVIKNLKF